MCAENATWSLVPIHYVFLSLVKEHTLLYCSPSDPVWSRGWKFPDTFLKRMLSLPSLLELLKQNVDQVSERHTVRLIEKKAVSLQDI